MSSDIERSQPNNSITASDEHLVTSTSQQNAAASESAPAKVKLGTKLKRHCRKWWWLDFLIFAAVILIIILPIIYVAIPRIAQSEVNKTTTKIVLEALSNPAPDAFDLHLNAVMRSPSRYHPNVDGFNASLSLDRPDVPPFAYIQIPGLRAELDTPIHVNQRVQIADLDQFTAYVEAVLSSQTFRVVVTGKTKLHLGALPAYSVTFDQAIGLKGLNGLSGFALNDSNIHLPPLDDGTTLTALAIIPNPSVISVEMGNVTLNLLSKNGTYLGYTTIAGLTLEPQTTNTFPVRAVVPITNVLPFLENGVLSVQIVGNSSVNSQGEQLEYFSRALASNVIRYDVNITQALARVMSGGNSTTNTTTV